VTALLSILDFHKLYVQLPRAPIRDPSGNLLVDPNRMYGPGIFGDPNDVCVLIVTGLLLVLGRLADRRLGPLRWGWLVALGIFGYGFYLTQSRGGLLALLLGLGVFVRLRFGWRGVFVLGCLGVPALAAVLGARQLAISSETNTGQTRIELWNEGLVMFRNNPIFGIGWNRFDQNATHVAHNSYVQAFAELGFAGGVTFLGAAALAAWGLYRLALPVRTGQSEQTPRFLDPDLEQLYPYLAGAFAGYAGGMITLTLNNLVTTYGMLGAVSLFLAMAPLRPSRPPLRFDVGMLGRAVVLGLLFVLGWFFFIRAFLRV
jgi:O-antigen ligase